MKHLLLSIIALSLLAISCQKLPVIEKFSGRKSVSPGSQTSLSWEVKNAKNLILKNNLTGEEQTITKGQNKFKFKPTDDFSYTLSAENSKGKAKKTFKGTIRKTAPLIEFFRGSTKYEVGKPELAYLEWRVHFAKRVYMRKLIEDVPVKDRLDSLAPDTTTTYELVAIGQFDDTVSAKHTIKVIKPRYSIEVKDRFKTKAAIIGKDNTVKWNFEGAEWVRREYSNDTLEPRGNYKINPKASKDGYYTEKFYVKYPAQKQISTFTYQVPLESYKAYFKPSTLKTEPKTPVTLNWDVIGTKKYEVYQDGVKVAEGIEGKDNYTYYIKKNSNVMLVLYDQQDQQHVIDWKIKCGIFRPFITNAIDYKEIKNESKKRRLIFEIFQVDRSNYPEEVKLRVVVADTFGNFVRGLAPPSISNTEARRFFREIIERSGSKYQKINDFKVEEINEQISKPYDVAFCLDYSGSMAYNIKSLEHAVRKMVNQKNPDDRFSIVKFDDSLKTEIRLENDINKILSEVPWQGLGDEWGGGTALYAGADEALEALSLDNKTRQKILFLFTDGHENSSFLHSENNRLFRANDLIKKARKYGIKIYPIGFGDATNDALLDALGWMTDGFAFQVDNRQKLEAAYSEIPRLFRNYYEITYKPLKNQDAKGEKGVSLKYYNNQKTTATTTKYQVNEDFEVDEEKGKNVPIGSLKNKKQVLVPPQVVAYFNFDRYDLKLEFLPNIEVIYKFLAKNPELQIDITGHTDLVGTIEKNMLLSKQRAESVQQYLIRKGISKDRMHIIAKGKSKPIWRIEDEPWQAAENRRIEITVWE